MALETRSQMLNDAFAALADPTRRAILKRLTTGSADVSELMKPFGLTQPTISKHLRVLEKAGFIVRGRDAQRRPRKLVPVAFREVDDWIAPFRRQWEGRFDNLERHLGKQNSKGE